MPRSRGHVAHTAPALGREVPAAAVLRQGAGTVPGPTAAAPRLRSFLKRADARERDRERAVQVLTATGASSSLSWMTTWAGNRYWFAPEGTGYIAYRAPAGTALSLGAPICPPAQECSVLQGFAASAADQGLTPCLYAVPEHTRAAAAELGWGSVRIAEEAILDLPGLEFTGKRHQNTRTALNRARREGIRACWTNYDTAPRTLREQIREVSDEWIADKGVPEMGFTLGGLEELKDSHVRLLLALDPHGCLHAVSSWLPVHAGGQVTGWTLDLMRRRRDGFRPAMEFLIASAALDLKSEGYETISLSAAPLARSGPPAAGETALDKALLVLGTALESVYGFSTLRAFKDRFHPRWEPLYLAYPDPAALPSIAAALTSAYLPDATWAQRLTLVRRIVGNLLPRPLAGLGTRTRGGGLEAQPPADPGG